MQSSATADRIADFEVFQTCCGGSIFCLIFKKRVRYCWAEPTLSEASSKAAAANEFTISSGLSLIARFTNGAMCQNRVPACPTDDSVGSEEFVEVTVSVCSEACCGWDPIDSGSDKSPSLSDCVGSEGLLVVSGAGHSGLVRQAVS